MKGAVRKRGDTWSYYFNLGLIDGKRKKKEKGGFKTKKEAEKALRDAISEFEKGYIEPTKVNFTSVSTQWLEEYIKPLRKITTYSRYKEMNKKYLIPYLGFKEINKITALDIERMLLDIKKNNISDTTLQGIYTLCNSIFERSIKLHLIQNNPCKGVERPQRNKKQTDVLEVEEIPLLIKTLDLENEYDYMFYVAFRLTLELGLRRGELAGLTWEDISYGENVVSIHNNLIYNYGHTYMETTKTKGSTRTIYVSNELLEMLTQLNKRQEFKKNEYGEFYENNIFNDKSYDLVMRWDNGKYIHPMYYTNKIKKVVAAAGIDKTIRFHDLRHTNATLLIQQGVDFKTVQTRLGHEDINTTLNIYAHVNKEMQKNATEKLNNIFGGKLVAKK
ncbi:tyrosine-type recombinase/integrase [Inconstantimicrobium mannanitabidum]|uniref:Site-specific integrase n=1 Tax=Inconstantimicrobium mannanitabidum TaxID=1604901 RepID=A0ACB5R988_9CLOT|nr:site-specific integrase [Clostridium sp. TW13]GKX65601.1 site-specific integrase [Clostridium sp. TW13]